LIKRGRKNAASILVGSFAVKSTGFVSDLLTGTFIFVVLMAIWKKLLSISDFRVNL